MHMAAPGPGGRAAGGAAQGGPARDGAAQGPRPAAGHQHALGPREQAVGQGRAQQASAPAPAARDGPEAQGQEGPGPAGAGGRDLPVPADVSRGEPLVQGARTALNPAAGSSPMTASRDKPGSQRRHRTQNRSRPTHTSPEPPWEASRSRCLALTERAGQRRNRREGRVRFSPGFAPTPDSPAHDSRRTGGRLYLFCFDRTAAFGARRPEHVWKLLALGLW